MLYKLIKRFFSRKRTEVMQWEIDFLQSVFSQLKGKEEIYEKLHKQATSGIIKGVLIGYSDLPNYVGFKYANTRNYENLRSENFQISGICVKDALTGQEYTITIYVYYDLIGGYRIIQDKPIKEYQFDVSSIDISHSTITSERNEELEKIRSLLSKEEFQWIEKDVYPIELNENVYYSIRQLEDGDFLGIDKDNHIYKITHDPYEIVQLERERLVDFLQQPTADFYETAEKKNP